MVEISWINWFLIKIACKYRESPDSTVFMPPGNRTIAKTVLIGDWFSIKLQFMTFGFSKSPFLHDLSIAHKKILVFFLTKNSPNLHYNQTLMQNPHWEILWNWWPNVSGLEVWWIFLKKFKWVWVFRPNLVKIFLKFSRNRTKPGNLWI